LSQEPQPTSDCDALDCVLLDHGFHTYTNGPCCFTNGFKPGVKSYHELKQYPLYLEIKQTMQQGQWHSACHTCRDTETLHHDLDNCSKRQQTLKSYGHTVRQHSDQDLVFLSYDVGSLCNLSCRSCHPYLSSSWLKEWSKVKPMVAQDSYQYSIRPPADLSHHNLQNLRFLEILGGEPFYNPRCFEIIQKVIEATDNQCDIYVTTNGTVFPDIEQYPWFKNNAKIRITLSIDAVGVEAEFVRTGTNWARLEHNVARYHDLGIQLGGHITHSVLNMFEKDKILDWCHQHDVTLSDVLTLVTNRPCLTYAVLTDSERRAVCDWLINTKDHRIIPHIQAARFDAHSRQQFFEFMAHTKLYHGLDWQHSLPQLWRLMHSS